MPAVARVAVGDIVAIGEQHRVARLVRRHPHRIAAEHVGPVGEEGDSAEALGLALGAEEAARRIESHQLGVRLRRDLYLGFHLMGVARKVDDQPSVLHPVIVPRLAVDEHGKRDEPVAVERQRLLVPAIALNVELRTHARPRGIEVEIECNLRHAPLGRPVVLAAMNGRRGGGCGLDVEHGGPVA